MKHNRSASAPSAPAKTIPASGPDPAAQAGLPAPQPAPQSVREPAHPLSARADRWTPQKMADFLRELAATNNVAAAAKSVGMSRQGAYDLRARLKGSPFDIGWEAAFQHGYDNLAHVALERALNGVEVPHYHKGELIGTSRKFDERLTVALLAMRNRFGAPMLVRYGAAAEFHAGYWEDLLAQITEGRLDWELGDHAETMEEAAKALTRKYAPDDAPRRLPRLPRVRR